MPPRRQPKGWAWCASPRSGHAPGEAELFGAQGQCGAAMRSGTCLGRRDEWCPPPCAGSTFEAMASSRHCAGAAPEERSPLRMRGVYSRGCRGSGVGSASDRSHPRQNGPEPFRRFALIGKGFGPRSGLVAALGFRTMGDCGRASPGGAGAAAFGGEGFDLLAGVIPRTGLTERSSCLTWTGYVSLTMCESMVRRQCRAAMCEDPQC